ncbi:MAG TPA: glycosyltransferase 87 family protein [Terriglobales bacterium]|nr:glycosyltransferase 87 family protein [Terriglobales bacterium]
MAPAAPVPAPAAPAGRGAPTAVEWTAFAAAIAAFFALGLRIGARSVDFPVYCHAVLAWRAHGPIYGPHSGLGWPMYYRYPPVFLLFFFPFALLPVAAAAAIWLAGKAAALLAFARAFGREFGWPRALAPSPAWLAAILLLAPYLVLEFRYGNVEFYIVALCAAALLLAPRRPALAGALLGLAIAVKVWPLFFVPYWLATRRRRPAAVAIAVALLLTLAPALVFGWAGNLHLLGQWAAQESTTALHAGTIWFPNQSLRGVLTRALPFSDPAITRLWLPLDLAAYLAFLGFARSRREPAAAPTSVAAAFCLLPILAPFTHVKDLVVLLWPALTLGWLFARRTAASAAVRGLCSSAAILAGAIPLVPGGRAQHWLQLKGADFVVLCLLAAGLLRAMSGGGSGAQARPNRQMPDAGLPPAEAER